MLMQSNIKFLVDGHPVWWRYPHPAWVSTKSGKERSSPTRWRKEIAGHFIKTGLESGEGVTGNVLADDRGDA